uniref:DNA polymerase eta n=1 Tax=Guillardia theta TaxID=55529 RepID=A0A7S4K9V7_GUITH|mmetsp:Transcript_22233/g.73158  ORF Transcript_22233/g.73158 Transcript_22233/m.73158 type:complete len:650 (+) Transcript_22233:223-2172(+)
MDSLLYRSLVNRVILHIDMDAFYAQVEHRRTGISREEPLAVQQWEGLIAVNYPARARGITRHMRVEEAKKICPDLHLVHVEIVTFEGDTNDKQLKQDEKRDDLPRKVSLERYRNASMEVFEVLQQYGIVEKASIDEAYIDVTKTVNNLYRRIFDLEQNDADKHGLNETNDRFDEISEKFCNISSFEDLERTSKEFKSYGTIDTAKEEDLKLLLGAVICQAARAGVLEHTSFTCSGGISHNKMLSKLASARHKPNQQTIVPVQGVQSLMEQLPLKNIRGLGGKFGNQLCSKLNMLQLHGKDPCAADVQKYSSEVLQRIFGEKQGKWIYQVVRGVDDDPVKERDKSKSILAFKSFAPIYNEAGLDCWIMMLCADLAKRIFAERQMKCRKPRHLTVHYTRFQEKGRKYLESRTCPMPSSVLLDSSTPESICRALEETVRTTLSRVKDLYPCCRLAIGAGDFLESSDNSIMSFLVPKHISDSHLTTAYGDETLKRNADTQTGKNLGIMQFFNGSSRVAHSSGDQSAAPIPLVNQVTSDSTLHKKRKVVASEENCMSKWLKSDSLQTTHGKDSSIDESVKVLVEMGFEDEQKIRLALKQSNLNVEQAIEVLINNLTGMNSTTNQPPRKHNVVGKNNKNYSVRKTGTLFNHFKPI